MLDSSCCNTLMEPVEIQPEESETAGDGHKRQKGARAVGSHLTVRI